MRSPLGVTLRGIYSLEEIAPEAGDVAGTGVVALATLARAGLPVPQTFVLTPDAMRDAFDKANITRKLDDMLSAIEPLDRAALRDASNRARTLVERMDAPSCFDQVRGSFERLGGAAAVRDAALPDDGTTAAATVALGVATSDELIDAIRAAWAALFTSSALTYRASCGRALADAACTVIVQRMEPRAAWGIARTGPAAGDGAHRIAVEAMRDGAASPDLYECDAEATSIENRVIVDAPILTDGEALAVAALAARAERALGEPQEIAWSGGDGAFFALGTRIAHAPDHEH